MEISNPFPSKKKTVEMVTALKQYEHLTIIPYPDETSAFDMVRAECGSLKFSHRIAPVASQHHQLPRVSPKRQAFEEYVAVLLEWLPSVCV